MNDKVVNLYGFEERVQQLGCIKECFLDAGALHLVLGWSRIGMPSSHMQRVGQVTEHVNRKRERLLANRISHK